MFSDQELAECLDRFGYEEDIEQFLTTMDNPEVVEAVLADIVEARALEIGRSPAVVFNGRQLGIGSGKGLMESVLAAMRIGERPEPEPSSDAARSPIDLSFVDLFPPQFQETALASTVRIHSNHGRFIGSGAIVARRDPFVYVLTAYHVAPPAQRVEVHTFSGKTYPQPSGVYEWASVIASSESADLALLRFSTRDPVPEPLRIATLEELPSQTPFPVLAIGSDGAGSAPSCVGSEVLSTQRVRRTASSSSVTVWEVAKESTEGWSGGPLVDQGGRLLGVASGNSDGKGYFCHARQIHRFLQQHGLQGLARPRRTATDSSRPIHPSND